MKAPGLSLSLAAALFAACAPPAPPAAPEPAPPPVASATPLVASVAPPPPAPAGPGNNTPVRPSALVDEVKRLGVDFTRPLAQLSIPLKKKLMPLFVKSLGYESCSGCHVEGDFKAETRNLKAARQMWDHFIVAMRDASGEPLFCDSCHAGKAKNLDRTDQRALRAFMAAEYSHKLTRADKGSNGCGYCHGYPFEPHLIDRAWGASAK